MKPLPPSPVSRSRVIFGSLLEGEGLRKQKGRRGLSTKKTGRASKLFPFDTHRANRPRCRSNQALHLRMFRKIRWIGHSQQYIPRRYLHDATIISILQKSIWKKQFIVLPRCRLILDIGLRARTKFTSHRSVLRWNIVSFYRRTIFIKKIGHNLNTTTFFMITILMFKPITTNRFIAVRR